MSNTLSLPKEPVVHEFQKSLNKYKKKLCINSRNMSKYNEKFQIQKRECFSALSLTLLCLKTCTAGI